MIEVKKIEEALTSVFAANKIIKHSIKVIGGKNPTLEICIASADQKVDLELCEKVSNEISDVLDQIDDSGDAYMLDVCSFGAERELVGSEDIASNVGSFVHIELINPTKGFDQLEGTLIQFENNQLQIEYADKAVKRKMLVDLDNIKLIRLAVKF